MASQQELEILIKAQDEATATLKKVQGSVSGLGEKAAAMGKAIAVAGVAAGAAVTAFAASSLKDFSEVGDAVEKMSKRTGFAAESVSALRVAADASGTSIESIEGAIKKMSIGFASIGEEGSVMAEVLSANNMEWEEMAQLAPADMFEKLGNMIGAIEDPIMRTNAAVEVFGKSGTDLIPMFEGGAFSMEQWSEQAKKLGVSFDDLSAAKAAALNDAIGKLSAAWQGLKLRIGGELAPVITDLIENRIVPLAEKIIAAAPTIEQMRAGFANLMDSFRNAMTEFEARTGLISQVQEGFAKIWAVVQEELVPALLKLWEAVKPLQPYFEALATVALAGLVLALKATVEIVVFLATEATKLIALLAEFAATVFNVLRPAIEFLTGAWKAMADGIQSVINKFNDMKNAAISAYNAARNAVANIPLVGGALSGALPGRASGGPVEAGHAYRVGENGPEVFVPRQGGTIVPNAGPMQVTVLEGANITVRSDADIRAIVSQVSATLAKSLQSQRNGLATAV